MSAGKHTRVPTTEERLAQLERERVNVEQRNSQLQAEIRQQQQNTSARLLEQDRQMRERDNRYQQVINGLESDIKEASQAHQKAISNVRTAFENTIKTQNDNFNKAFQKQNDAFKKDIKNVRNWTKQRLDSNRNEMLTITAQQQRQLNEERYRIDGILNRIQQNRTAANSRLQDLDKLISGFDKEFPHPKYAPGKLDRIKSDYQSTVNALQSGMEQAAWAQTTATHRALMILQEEVIQEQTKFEITFAETIRALDTILQIIKKNPTIEIDSKARVVNEWTNGEYEKLSEDIASIINRLETQKDKLTTEQVQAELDKVGILEERQIATVQKATNSILASREREVIARNIAGALNKVGYKIIDGNGYEENNPQNSYLVKAKITNAEGGSEILVIVEPEESDKGIHNRLHTEFIRSHFPDDSSRKMQHEKVAATLKEIGINVGETTCVSSQLDGVEKVDVKEVTKSGKSLPQNIRQQIKNRR